MTPFFSILMPAYNVESYIGETLEAINSQYFKNWELIIIDDGSTDKTREILLKYRNFPQYKIHFSDYNSGNPFLVRSKAFQYASAPYIVMIDADDKVDPYFLQVHYDSIKKYHPEMVLSEMWKKEGENQEKILPYKLISENRVYEGRELVKLTLENWRISLNGYAIKKEIFKEAILKTNRLIINSIHTDELMGRYMLLLSDKVVFTKARYYYRYNPTSITHNNNYNRIMGNFVTNECLIKLTCEEYGLDTQEYWMARRKQLIYVIEALKALNDKDLLPSESKKIEDKVKEVKSLVGTSKIKDSISLPYRMAILSAIPIGRKIVRAIDCIKKFKDKK